MLGSFDRSQLGRRAHANGTRLQGRALSRVVLALVLPVAQLQLPFPPRHLGTSAVTDTRLRPQLFDIRLALFCPLEHEVATEEMGVAKGRVGALRFVARRELEERKPTRAVVELPWQADGLQLRVGPAATQSSADLGRHR